MCNGRSPKLIPTCPVYWLHVTEQKTNQGEKAQEHWMNVAYLCWHAPLLLLTFLAEVLANSTISMKALASVLPLSHGRAFHATVCSRLNQPCGAITFHEGVSITPFDQRVCSHESSVSYWPWGRLRRVES